MAAATTMITTKILPAKTANPLFPIASANLINFLNLHTSHDEELHFRYTPIYDEELKIWAFGIIISRYFATKGVASQWFNAFFMYFCNAEPTD
jgi:hypothetical protein